MVVYWEVINDGYLLVTYGGYHGYFSEGYFNGLSMVIVIYDGLPVWDY